MVRFLSSFTNLCHRQIPSSYQGRASQIQNRYLSIEQINGKSVELMQNPDENFGQNIILNPGAYEGLMQKPPNSDLGQNQIFSVSEIAKEVSSIIRTRPRWEETLLIDFPTVNFVEPNVYNEILKQQNNTFLLLRFYLWLKGLNTSSSDPALCNVIFKKLVETGAAKAAKNFLDNTKFDPEPLYLELYITCLCENGLIDESLDVFERLKVIGHCPSLQTWNWALSHSVRTKRVDAVWKLYSDMTENGTVTDVNTFGHLIRACCLEKDVKGYELLQQVLQAGHVPDNTVFNTLISSLCKKGEYGKVSGVLHNMIAKNCSPNIYTYKGVINGLSSGIMQQERFRIFNELKERGHFPDRDMYTTMIRSLCREKDLGSARKLWFEMIQRGIRPNEFTYSDFIREFWKNGCFDEAEKLFKEMLEKNYVKTSRIHKTVIRGMCTRGKVKEARILFEKVKEKGIHCDGFIYSSLIKGFSLEGKIVEGMHFLLELLKQGLKPSNTSFSILIKRLCEDGHVDDAEILWQEIRNRGLEPEIYSLNQMIFGLGNNGRFDKAMEWFRYMVDHGGRPKKSTSERLLQCLSEVNRLDDALSVLGYFMKMGFTLKKSVGVFLQCKLGKDSLCQLKNG